MDERLKSLADQGADITIKIRKQNSLVLIRHDKETYKASGGTFEKALDRVLDSMKSSTKSLKAKRRQKEQDRQDLLEDVLEWEADGGTSS